MGGEGRWRREEERGGRKWRCGGGRGMGGGGVGRGRGKMGRRGVVIEGEEAREVIVGRVEEEGKGREGGAGVREKRRRGEVE